jgi:hypothetical protein
VRLSGYERSLRHELPSRLKEVARQDLAAVLALLLPSRNAMLRIEI